MKKVKLLLMMTALATVLCACGSEGKTQLTEADLETMSDVELEALIEEQVANLEKEEGQGNGGAEDAQASGATQAVEETFECLPEMLEADWEDCLFQVDNTILRDDHTMSLGEVISALQNSGVEYSFKVDNGGYQSESVEYNSDMLVMGKSHISVEVYKGDVRYFVMYANNTSEETVKAGDAAVIFDMITAPHDSFYKNTYYCKGLRGDGEGQTYESMKEIFAKYADIAVEKNERVANRKTNESINGISVNFEVKIENAKGEKITIYYSYAIDPTDSSCVCMHMYTNVYNF